MNAERTLRCYSVLMSLTSSQIGNWLEKAGQAHSCFNCKGSGTFKHCTTGGIMTSLTYWSLVHHGCLFDYLTNLELLFWQEMWGSFIYAPWEGHQSFEEEELPFVAESSWNRWRSAWGQMMKASTGVSAEKGNLGNTGNAPVLNAAEALVTRGVENTEVQNVLTFLLFWQEVPSGIPGHSDPWESLEECRLTPSREGST